MPSPQGLIDWRKFIMLVTFEEESKRWADKGFIAVKGSLATEEDLHDVTKVILYWA